MKIVSLCFSFSDLLGCNSSAIFGGGCGKIVKLGKIPFNLQTQVFWNAVRPDNTVAVALRVQVQMLLPK